MMPAWDHGAGCGTGCAWLPESSAIACATSALVICPCVTLVQASAAGCTAGALRLMPALWICVGESWPWVFGSGKREKPCLRMHCANETKASVWACCCGALGPLLAPGTRCPHAFRADLNARECATPGLSERLMLCWPLLLET